LTTHINFISFTRLLGPTVRLCLHVFSSVQLWFVNSFYTNIWIWMDYRQTVNTAVIMKLS